MGTTPARAAAEDADDGSAACSAAVASTFAHRLVRDYFGRIRCHSALHENCLANTRNGEWALLSMRMARGILEATAAGKRSAFGELWPPEQNFAHIRPATRARRLDPDGHAEARRPRIWCVGNTWVPHVRQVDMAALTSFALGDVGFASPTAIPCSAIGRRADPLRYQP